MMHGFDEVSHEYWQKGTKVPGVTTVLRAANIVDPKWFTEEARRKGTLVHDLTMQIDEDTIPISPRSKRWDVPGEVTAYLKFLNEIRPQYRLIEIPMLHPVLPFGGKPDRVCRNLLGSPAHLEIKTGSPASWHGVQLAGYQLLEPTGARYVLYLKPNGSYRLVQCKRAEDYDEFYRALDAYHKAA
jgi:hypothetical protein